MSLGLPRTTSWRIDWRQSRTGGGLLIVASVLVGFAIAADDPLARVLNGVGGLCWLGAAVLLARSLRTSDRCLPAAIGTIVVVLVLAVAVRPSDLSMAIVGFVIGGVLVAAVGIDRPVRWALLVPALWLPAHLSIAIGRVIVNEGGQVRTEPPPTAALVPLAMVLAAGAGGLAVARLRGQSAASRVKPRVDALSR